MTFRADLNPTENSAEARETSDVGSGSSVAATELDQTEQSDFD